MAFKILSDVNRGTFEIEQKSSKYDNKPKNRSKMPFKIENYLIKSQYKQD